eukprot:Hpha_TRINITY_DN13060_c0_g1::TRINITY_DN13060_c0_g1_i1::g.69159::m.69159
MFARADRTFLNDANRARFSHQPPPSCNEPLSPGPTAYHPQGGRRGARTTRRFLFLREARKHISADELHKNVPGPGAYRQDTAATSHIPSPPAERQYNADRRRKELEKMSEAGITIGSDSGFQHPTLFSVSRVPRFLNMISGENEPHTLREYVTQRTARPGPSHYELPSLWHQPSSARSAPCGSHRRGCGPRAMIPPKSGRKANENVDGRMLDPESPGPNEYEPMVPAPPPKWGTIQRSPRDIEKLPESNVPGPGTYDISTRSPRGQKGRLSMQIPQAPRNLDRVVCGVDLKRQRKLPGPASYHPIHDNIVRQPYTV